MLIAFQQGEYFLFVFRIDLLAFALSLACYNNLIFMLEKMDEVVEQVKAFLKVSINIYVDS